eukprot:c17888_g1_i1.p1 GENE.c17888_g1_i1~~c17888_g1_i1.p1  ORF type:complete len:509 (+),score=88.80 c17888_g1_i1:2087-3613(+)
MLHGLRYLRSCPLRKQTHFLFRTGVYLTNRRLTLDPPAPKDLLDIRDLKTTFSEIFDFRHFSGFSANDSRALILELMQSAYIEQYQGSIDRFQLTTEFVPTGSVLLSERFAPHTQKVQEFLRKFYFESVAPLEFEAFQVLNSPPAFQPRLQEQFDNQRVFTIANAQMDFTFSIVDTDRDTSYTGLEIQRNGDPNDLRSSWLQFDPESSRFFGIPPKSEVGAMYIISVNASDGFASADSTFGFRIHAPPAAKSEVGVAVGATTGSVAGLTFLILGGFMIGQKIKEKAAREKLVENVSGLKEYLDTHVTHAKHKKPIVFISYTWGGTNDTIADALQTSLKERGWLVIRDKNYIEPGNMIREFMDLIAHDAVDAVIPIFCDKYFKRDNCMYEVVTMLKVPRKVIPILNKLDPEEPDYFDSKYRKGIFEFWKARQVELEREVINNPGDSLFEMRWRNAGHAVIEIQEFLAKFQMQLCASATEQLEEKFSSVTKSIEKLFQSNPTRKRKFWFR